MVRRVVLLSCLLLALNASAFAEESCSLEEVKVGYQAKTCAFFNYEFTLNGAVASGIGTGCISFDLFPNLTNKAWVGLKVNQTYILEGGPGLCITQVNFDVPQGYTLYIDGIETNTIIKTQGGVIFTGDGTWEILLRKNCDCGANQAGDTSQRMGSVVWDAGMGNLRDGRSAERLSIREKTLTAASYTPANLIYSPPVKSTEVEVLRDGTTLRQIKAPQAFADVVATSGSEYEVRYYRPTDVGPIQNGYYTFTGSPYVTWRITNPDPTTFKQLEIQKVEGGIVTNKTQYTWDPAIDSWTMKSGWTSGTNYARTETRTVSYPTPTSRTETFIVREGSTIISKRARTFLSYPWGEELVQEVQDPDAAALTTTYTYYENASETNRYRKIKTITFPDGRWEKYDYDQYWNIHTIMRPWKDLSLATATESNSHLTIYGYTNSDNGAFGVSVFARILLDVEEQINGITVKKTRYNRSIANIDPDMTAITDSSYATSTNGVPSNLVTETVKTVYRFSAPTFLANRVVSMVHADGRKDSYSYEKGNYVPNANPALSAFVPDANGLAERETVVHGTVASPNGVAFKTTEEITVRDQYGNTVLEESYIYNGTGYERVGWIVSDYDGRGHVVMTRNHRGETTTAVWSGQYKTSEIASNGVETVYEYDSLNRVKKQTKKGIAAGGGFPAQADIVTSYEYDAEGRQKSVTLGEGAGSLTTARIYDRVGRLIRETEPGDLSTTYTYTNGGRTQTVARPGGGTQVLDRYLDGQMKSVTGTAGIARTLDYGVNADGTQHSTEFVGTAGLSSPRWTKTTTDWAGRTTVIERPSFTGTNVVQTFLYNSLNQLQKETTTANATKLIADKLFEYDALGQQVRSGLDVDNSGTLTLLSTDRVAESDLSYEKVGADWFRVTSSKNYLTDNNDTPVVQVQRERLNNFPLNGSDQTVSEITSVDVAGQSAKTTSTTDRAAKKQITTLDTADSTTNAVIVTVNGLKQSSTPTTPQTATTYGYDSLGRLLTVTDPKTGVSSRSYNANGQLQSAGDGADTTTYAYYDKNDVNAGRVKSETNAAGKVVYFNYNSRGQVTQTWGDSTYPLEYVYDSYGQRTELHTFRAGQNWASTVWPAATTGTADMTKWIYQESTGLLTQKQDAALKGATFTYDELGHVKTRVWARGITCTYSYDVNTGELLTMVYSDSTPGVTFTYDRGGRPTTIADAAGSHARTFNVDGGLQTDQITGGILDTVSMTVGYDAFLRRNSLQTSQGVNTLSSQTYGYDSASRLETVTSGGQTATYAYYPTTGLLNTTTFTGGTNTARSYDGFGRLQNITTTPAADPAQSYAYQYNELNQRTRVTREDGSYWAYIYNGRGELTSGKKYWVDNSIVWGAQTEYKFDNSGNREYARAGGNQLGALRQSNYTTNSLNQYSQRTVPAAVDVTGAANSLATVSVNTAATARKGDYFYKELSVDNSSAPVYATINVVGARNNFGAGGEDAVTQKGGNVFLPRATEAFTYDFDGNLLTDGRWVYTWDGENRLTAMQAAAEVPATAKSKLEFSYDYLGRRIQKKVYSWNIGLSSYELLYTVKFVQDGLLPVVELDAGNALVRHYVWGQDVSGTLHGAQGVGGLLWIKDAGVVHLAGSDGMSVTTLVNATDGHLSAQYEYDPFGRIIKSVGTYAATNPVRFSSKYLDSETSLSYFGLRYYNADTGRWISSDPQSNVDQNNLYAYVSNASTNAFDPDGLQKRDWKKVHVREPEKDTPNWDMAAGQMDYTYHRIGICIPNMDLEKALSMIYKDFETFAHFNDPTQNIAVPNVQNGGAKVHFDMNPSFSSAAAFISGNSIDVALAKYPESRELFAMTLVGHPLVGVRKWAVRKRQGNDARSCNVDIDTEAYEQVDGVTTRLGRWMTGRGQQNQMWSTYLSNIAEYWKKNYKATELDRDFRDPQPAGRSDNPLKARLPANLQVTKWKEYDRIVQY